MFPCENSHSPMLAVVASLEVTCNSTQFVNLDGQCQDCPDGTRQYRNNTNYCKCTDKWF